MSYFLKIVNLLIQTGATECVKQLVDVNLYLPDLLCQRNWLPYSHSLPVGIPSWPLKPTNT